MASQSRPDPIPAYDDDQELEIRFLATERGGPRELLTVLIEADLGVHLSRDRIEERSGKPESVESLPSLLVPVAVRNLPKLLQILRNWLARNSTRQLDVKLGDVSIKVSNATAEEQSKLIDAAIRAAEAGRRESKRHK